MAKYRAIKNQKHALRKARNRIRRLGDSWYNRESIFKQRILGKREIKEMIDERISKENVEEV